MKHIIDRYDVFFEGVAIPISIYNKKDAFIPTYDVGVLELGEYSQVIVKKIKEDLLREGVLDSFSKKDSATYEEIKEAYMDKIKELLHYYLPNITFDERSKILTIILQTSFDLGYVDILINDPNIEEITVNGSQSDVMIYHRKYGWLHTNLNFNDDSEIRNISSRIAMENKKFFSNLNPLLDAHLIGGHRVNATLSPISTKGTTLTIRRFSDTPWTVCDLIRSGTSTPIGLALIWLAIENEFSIIVVGGTGSGKTSFLNAISGFIPASQRIISVEDTREIRLPEYAHWVPMESRSANQEGRGQISMLDLIVNSLRMRPDRIIIGEIRKKEEAEVLFEAMRTGHSVYGTFHANTAEEAMIRLTSSPIEIPKISLNSLGLIVVQHRDRKSGRRITLQIAEMDDEGNSRVIFQFNHKTNQLEMKQKPVYLLKRLDEFQGIDSQEFLEEMKHRAWVLNALTELGAKNITQVGKYVNKYQTQKELLLKKINSVLLKKVAHKKNSQTREVTTKTA
ncbi:MAG: type II/IV secretion system ATPase subunit [Candidatus Nanoarchaeia archaeon]